MSKHIHQYRRMTGRQTRANKTSGFKHYYKCADPTCNHYKRDYQILGKVSICNRCGKEFVLPNALRMLTNVPHCKPCTKKTRVTDNLHINEELDIEA